MAAPAAAAAAAPTAPAQPIAVSATSNVAKPAKVPNAALVSAPADFAKAVTILQEAYTQLYGANVKMATDLSKATADGQANKTRLDNIKKEIEKMK